MPFGNQFAAAYNSGSAPAGIIPAPSFGSSWSPPTNLPGTGAPYGSVPSSSGGGYAPTPRTLVPGARNLATAGANPDLFNYAADPSSVVNTTGGGGGGFHIPFLPFGIGSGGSSPPPDAPWGGNAGQPQPGQPGFLSRLFGGLLGAIPGAFGSVAHLGSLGIGSLLNRGTPNDTPPTDTPPGMGAPVQQAGPFVSSAGTPSQLASNAQTAFQTGFQNMQSASNPTFYKPDELTAGRGPTPSGPAPGTAAYKAAYPSGSTMADLQAFNSKIAAGSIPTFQQFMGQPAYKPPTVAPPKG